MSKTPDRELLRLLPKCEHHMHLEGALSPEVLFELAAKNNITLPTDDENFRTAETLNARYKRYRHQLDPKWMGNKFHMCSHDADLHPSTTSWAITTLVCPS
jgi:adenosine deaminase